ncbi:MULTISPECIES: hypothetical protein [Leptospira]|uniref:Phage neck terminator protein gp12-like domain-containing protein n=3 Tax=Leptospira santarosai TaxID=28183 RepID=A0AB73M897_9LEPT|nr:MULTISPECIES: hypothetical protein [Leptospira]AVV48655.1 Uncharacterized protein XB17_00030 [Leptospira santarosai]EKO78413.1 hypothetical protein LEP1GSC068_3543 [Leptospira sp. Fiocruz LV3954]EKT88360.1 hypothetical protein LSS_03179 [Leptospira santarosai serovar Shermani str. LT 821]EMI61653.1 hypothetical protein LEP1GSC076_3624 [Leptospira sp. Fiocruz LV4135]EMJ49178.1 hypothetical protein LEP1GSC169_1291 [Leptospira santarosai str. HAI1349]
MIANIRSIMTQLSENLGTQDSPFPIIRKNQAGPKPNYPYAAWGILLKDGERYNLKDEIENPDPTKITERLFKFTSISVSLSFFDIAKTSQPDYKPLDFIFDLGDRTIDYLEIIGKDYFESLGIKVDLIDQKIQDRTAFIDPIYEYQAGFDFTVRGIKDLLITVDAIDLEATYASITEIE